MIEAGVGIILLILLAGCLICAQPQQKRWSQGSTPGIPEPDSPIMKMIFHPQEGECSECGGLMRARAISEHPALSVNIECTNRDCKIFGELFAVSPIRVPLVHIGKSADEVQRKIKANVRERP